MGRDSDSMRVAAEHRAARDNLHYDWMLQSILKFRLFFVGLIFSILAFSIQFSVRADTLLVGILQAAAWGALLLAGLLALRDAGGLVTRYTEEVFEGLSTRARVVMWVLFASGMALIAAARLAGTHAP